MIFIDRSIPRSGARALQAVRDDVKWLEDVFPHNIKDADWLREAGLQGWLVISRDKKIRSRSGERHAIIENGVGCFCLTQKHNPTRWEYLKLLVNTVDEMEFLFGIRSRPFIYGITTEGTFRELYLRPFESPSGGPPSPEPGSQGPVV